MNIGFVYCFTNHYMPGICKIGRTDRSPSQRCKELSDSTSAPWPFDIQFYVEVDDSIRMERAIHSALSEHRFNDAREFFSCSASVAYDWLRRNADILTEYVDGDVLFDIHQMDQAERASAAALTFEGIV